MGSTKTLVFITGANQGVGFEAAKNILLQFADYHVLLGCRDLAKGSAAAEALKALPVKGDVTPIQIDVTNDASVDAAAALIEKTFGRLDILVNNAGIVRSGRPVRESLREVLATNVVGSISTTEACLGLLRKSTKPRLIFVSSSLASITHAADPGSPYYRPTGDEYRSSKAALSMLMVQYHNKLKDENFKVFGADPGLNATNLTGDPESLRNRGAAEPSVGGERIAAVIRGDRDADVGRVCVVNGVLPW